MAYRSNVADLSRPERSDRWERDRFEYERERDRFGDIRERLEEEDDRVSRRIPSRPAPRERAPSVDRRSRPPYDDDETIIRERRRVVYEDEPPRGMRRRASPPTRRFSPPASEVERRVVIEKERRYRSPSPRPGRLLRRQSSLDTFDRRHHDDFPPRHDHSVPPYVDQPLPRSRALPPPRVYAERDYYDEISVAEPRRYVEEHFHDHPTRVHEREIVRTRHRSRSRSRVSRVSRRGRSRSSRSRSSSSSGGTSLTTKSEYPKKGKTRIPARLVSKRALIDLGYPFVEEGNTIIVQKALGQTNIDEVLKLSDEYKKSELELLAARSSAGDIIEERRTEVVEYTTAPTMIHQHHHHHPPAPSGTGPIIVNAQPAPTHPVEVVKTTMIRETSPARSYTTASYDTTSYGTMTSYDTRSTTTAGPFVVEARSPYEVSSHVPVGPLAIVDQRRSSRGPDDIRSEIRHLERQLARHERHSSRDMIRAERLPTGELVLFEEEIETIEEPARGGVRIERDKRGPPPRLMKAMLATLT